MATLNAKARQERAYLLRELLLRPALRRRENPSPDYLSAITDLTDDLVVTDDNGVLTVSTTDMMGNATDHRHNTIVASRLIMTWLEQAGGTLTKSDIVTAYAKAFGSSVPAALSWLTEQELVTITKGVVTDISGDRRPSKARPALPADMVAPRSGGTTPSPAPSTTAAAARPRMDVGRLIEHPDPMAMAARMREQAMPSASFEVGDISSATKTPEKKTTVVIPDSAILTYKTAVLDRWAALGTPTATWAELGVKRPALGDLPEGWTPEKVLQHVIGSMRKQGELAVDEDAKTFTYVPAERAVKAVSDWLGRAALPGKLITPTAAARREDVLKVVPSGWNAETIATLALDAVMEKVDGGWMKTAPEVVETPKAPEPIEPAPEVVETPKPASAPAPAGDTTSPTPKTAPEGTVQMAPTEGKVAQKVEGKKSPDPVTPKTAETPAAPVNAPALEQKVDTLTTKVDGIAAALRTLPAPPTKERQMYTDAAPEARYVLETVLVQLKTKKRVAEEEGKGEQHFVMTRDDLKNRIPGRARVTATNPNPPDFRKHINAALELGRAMGVIDYTEKWLGGAYTFISHVNVMTRAELDRRVQRVLDIRAARKAREEEKNRAA